MSDVYPINPKQIGNYEYDKLFALDLRKHY